MRDVKLQKEIQIFGNDFIKTKRCVVLNINYPGDKESFQQNIVYNNDRIKMKDLEVLVRMFLDMRGRPGVTLDLCPRHENF